MVAHIFVTEKLLCYGVGMKVIGNVDKQETCRWHNNLSENPRQPFRTKRAGHASI
ncbi:MAG: putative transposase [Octadecabacter sp.]|jgi:putative transposase